MIGAGLRLLRERGPVTAAVIGASHLMSRGRRRLLNARENVTIHPDVTVGAKVELGTSGEIIVESESNIGRYAVLAPSGGRIRVGPDSLINVYGTLLGHGGIKIGEDVLIGPHTTIVAANHGYAETDIPMNEQPISKEGIQVGDDVWIGSNCTVLDGVTIGEGAVVATGSVVTESVPEYAVVGGVPADVIDTRR